MSIKRKISLYLNVIIILTVIFSTVSLFTGFKFMGQFGLFEPFGLKAFKYFTVDSNILAGFVSLIYLVFSFVHSEDKPFNYHWLYILKLSATTAVSLTMIITVFFLAPSAEHFYDLFLNSNLFMHLLTPVLCIISFSFFESFGKTAFPLSLTGLLPMLCYAAYYIPNILIHLENGKTSYEYDWYGFLKGGLNTIWFVMLILFSITLFISITLWALNKKKAK
jgi:hypothetical protein